MKNFLLGLLAGSGVTVLVCVFFSHSSQQLTKNDIQQKTAFADAMTEVFVENYSDLHPARGARGGGDPTAPSNFLRSIQKIDTTHCPKEFQLAWFDYCTAATQAAKGNPAFLEELGAAVALATGHVLVAGKLANKASDSQRQAQARQSSSELAFRACRKIALEYGAR